MTVGVLPLNGIRILDASWVYAGPTCTRILADMGADVIVVENVNRLDTNRLWFPAENVMEQFWNRAGYHNKRHMSKRGITLDLNHPKAVEAFKRLVAWADILVESFSPRVLRNFGLDYPALKEIRPDLIMLSMSGFGQKGPRADWVAYGMGLDGLSGVAAITGYEGGQPLRTAISYSDPIAGIFGAGAVLVALAYKRRTGHGQYIDLSQMESTLGFIGEALMDHAMNQRVWPRTGNRDTSMAPHNCYRCRGEDSWVAIAVATDEEWGALRGVMGEPEWARDERFATTLGRWQNQQELDALIETWTHQHDHRDVEARLQSAGVPAAAVLNNKELVGDPHLRARRFFQLMDHAIIGKRLYPRQVPAVFNGERASARRMAPLLGEHNREVLRGIAGLSEEEVEQLEQEGAIGTEPAYAPRITPQFLANLQLPVDALIKAGAIVGMDPDYRERQLEVAPEEDAG